MIINGNCLEELDRLNENSVDAIVTDPPYELNFMGKGWDNAGVSFNKETWEKCLRVLKPGGYLLAFGGSRTYHRIACAIEDAGFEIRDCIMWLYGSGFPKALDIGKAVDKKRGVESKIVGKGRSGSANTHTRCMNSQTLAGKDVFGGEYDITEAQNEWKGWKSALKPAYEPIIVARKPFKGSLVDNVIENRVGGLNIDECRISHNASASPHGRFPANTILTYDESDFDEVCGGLPIGGRNGSIAKRYKMNNQVYGEYGYCNTWEAYNDSGSAARYFYCAKASKKDRDEGLEEFEGNSADMSQNRSGKMKKNTHPTVKPTTLMQYLVRLVAPKGATILDPFMGSGSTGKAVMYENKERDAGYKFIGIELDKEYYEIAKRRIGV